MKRIRSPKNKLVYDTYGVILTPHDIYMILIEDDDGGAVSFQEAERLNATVLYKDDFLESRPDHIERNYRWKGFGEKNPLDYVIENNGLGVSSMKKESPL
ncbi:hypothetical protein_gp264 [Bacillus phage vB_BceM_WH1]|nr:hypothetical protein_gp264 [Bacillus phage vB_BceM_WH1]